jgi:hypothetical protein
MFVESDAKGTRAKITAKEKSEMHLFRFIFGQWDTHEGNRLLQTNGSRTRIALIDNAGISLRLQTRYGQFGYWSKGALHKVNSIANRSKTFPFNSAKTVQKPTAKTLFSLFHSFIDRAQRDYVLTRYAKVIYVIWHNHLWLQSALRGFTLDHTNDYYRSEITAYRSLTAQALRNIWGQAALTSPELKTKLPEIIALTLDRRGQVLKAAHNIKQG